MKWIKNKLAPQSFRYRVFLISVISLVIPGIFSLGIFNYLTKDTLKEQALSNAEREINIANEYVSKLYEDMLYIANFVQLDPEMNSMLKGELAADANQKNDGYSRYLNEKKINKTIENITLVGEKSYVTILLKNGWSFTNYSVSDYDPRGFLKEEWFNELGKSVGYKSIWIDTQPTQFVLEKRANPYQISVARTLRDENLRIYGYVIVTIMENKVSDIFKNMHGYEDIMLLNANGEVLSHRDDSKIGEKFNYSSKSKKENSADVLEVDNKKYVLAEHNLAFANWKIVSLVPFEQSVDKINSIFNKIFLVQVISFAIFLILLTYLMKTVTRPLVYLANVADKVNVGDLTIRSQIQGRDEIGRLSKSFDHMLDHINESIREITDTQERKRKAELAMLQAQINPHFLFNVLNSIRMKVLVKGDKESATMISSLSKLLRMTIDKNKEVITLLEEIEIVKDYVQIMNMRQKQKVMLSTFIEAETHTVKMPRFILQPIIENSIIHGLNQSSGNIIIRTEYLKNFVVIIIEDDGQGMKLNELYELKRKVYLSRHSFTDALQSNKKGFSSLGLTNVYERLYMVFGPEFRMDIKSNLETGTKIILELPMKGGISNV